jgi:hypothetical protein
MEDRNLHREFDPKRWNRDVETKLRHLARGGAPRQFWKKNLGWNKVSTTT